MPAFNPKLCVDNLARYLATVAGITGGAGQVHKRRRIVRNEADIKTLLAGTGGKVNAWMISPAAANTTVTERHPGFNAIGVQGGGRVLSTLQFAVEAYYQLDDAAGSEETFRDLTWTVVDGLNSYGVLFDGAIFQLPADIEQFGFIALAGLGFYHYARIGCGWRGQTRP
jgi:hypothetical protein